MTNLERRALLGDRQAQEECTRRGIILRCPRCGKNAASEKYCMGDFWYECEDCHTSSGFHSSTKMALEDWNTRPAPPIGRCGECRFANTEDGGIYCELDDYQREEYEFCSEFEPKGSEENG